MLTLFSQGPIQNMLYPGENSAYLMFCGKRIIRSSLDLTGRQTFEAFGENKWNKLSFGSKDLFG